ncbi:hypothetical protein [Mycobacterium sp. NPDC050441]|uniref:hypothetical protein n=1 Tax=Mycobacterium sp. NPDC050441 TaxID=3155403 RepID=UPI003405EEBC
MGRWWVWVLWGGLACWLVGFWWHWSRTSWWIFDILMNPLMGALYLLGLAAVVVAAMRGRRWVVLATVVPVLVVVTVVVNSGWMLAPRMWFAMHRPLFDRALEADPGDDYYGNQLPWMLRFLTADGKASDQLGNRFFPQWIGIPDDAGGYLYNPNESPEGLYMYGLVCNNPVDLGGGWWMCGLRNNGL